MSSARVLITGFEPFDGHRMNVSWELAQALAAQSGSGQSWHAACLPCAFGEAALQLGSLVDARQPDYVFALGQAEGRGEITIERVALNVRDARIPDNLGCEPVDEPIVEGAPLAYQTGLPYRRLVRELRARGHPVALSNTAGTFVCNEVFYVLMHQTEARRIRSGFVHLPILPEQQLTPAEATERVAREDAPLHAKGPVPSLAFDRQLAALIELVRITIEAERPSDTA
jgi:pyroglutamyl-peptidase